MNELKHPNLIPLFLTVLAIPLNGSAQNVGVGAKPIPGAEVIIDGSRKVLDAKLTKHGMGAVINETDWPYHAYNGVGKWNAYDITFRAARFAEGKRVETAMLTMYFNGVKVHTNQPINQVWGGPNSGIDGGNDGGKGITDKPGGLKLQCEGQDVRYRNTWIKELELKDPNTNF